MDYIATVAETARIDRWVGPTKEETLELLFKRKQELWESYMACKLPWVEVVGAADSTRQTIEEMMQEYRALEAGGILNAHLRDNVKSKVAAATSATQ